MARNNTTTILNPDRSPFPISKKELEKLYLIDEKSLEDIGKQINRSRQCVARWMEYWGIKRRKTIEASKLKMVQKNNLRGPNWQGGKWWAERLKTWFVYAPNHPKCKHNGCVAEHILLAEEMIGRYLEKDEVVHHKNANRNDNSKENFCVMSKSSHMNLHRILGDIGITLLNQGQINLIFNNTKFEKDRDLISRVYIKKDLIVK